MMFHVINCSRKSDAEIKAYIENFAQELNKHNINCGNIIFNIDNDSDDFIRNSVRSIIVSNSKTQESLIDSKELLDLLCQFDTMKNKLIIIGEELNTNAENLWGEAREGLAAVIKHVSEKNIWHEVAHILGVDDHYSSHNRFCSLKKDCVMGYGVEQGSFCYKAFEEIKVYLSNSKA